MEWLEYIYKVLLNFWGSLSMIFSYIWSIFESLWYGLTTLLTGTYDIAVKIFTSGLF